MPIHELIDRLYVPLAFAIVLIMGTAAHLVRQSSRIDRWPLRSDDDVRGQALARAAVLEAGRILGRTTLRAALLVTLLFSGVALLNQLV